MILGGAVGNIRDRFELGYVIDYADFHIGDFRPFLIFNIADAAITIGVVIILARSLLVRDKEGTETGESPRGEQQDA
jgi:signal peptidase II